MARVNPRLFYFHSLGTWRKGWLATFLGPRSCGPDPDPPTPHLPAAGTRRGFAGRARGRGLQSPRRTLGLLATVSLRGRTASTQVTFRGPERGRGAPGPWARAPPAAPPKGRVTYRRPSLSILHAPRVSVCLCRRLWEERAGGRGFTLSEGTGKNGSGGAAASARELGRGVYGEELG